MWHTFVESQAEEVREAGGIQSVIGPEMTPFPFTLRNGNHNSIRYFIILILSSNLGFRINWRPLQINIYPIHGAVIKAGRIGVPRSNERLNVIL